MIVRAIPAGIGVRGSDLLGDHLHHLQGHRPLVWGNLSKRKRKKKRKLLWNYTLIHVLFFITNVTLFLMVRRVRELQLVTLDQVMLTSHMAKQPHSSNGEKKSQSWSQRLLFVSFTVGGVGVQLIILHSACWSSLAIPSISEPPCYTAKKHVTQSNTVVHWCDS